VTGVGGGAQVAEDVRSEASMATTVPVPRSGRGRPGRAPAIAL